MAFRLSRDLCLPRPKEILVLGSLAFLVLACGRGDESVPGAAEGAAPTAEEGMTLEALEQEVATWRQERHDRLLEPNSWLSLVGLDWLEPGENTVGSTEGHTVRLPESVSADFGVLTLDTEGPVSLRLAEGVEAMIGETPAPTGEAIPMATDASGEPTEIATGTVRFYVIERQGRFAVRIKDSAAPAFARFDGIEAYPVSLDYRLKARFEANDPPVTVEIPSVLGGSNPVDSPGAVVFELGGEEHRIDAMSGGDDGSLFLVFGDTTNPKTTYGGGRFLYTDPPAEDGSVVLDFNYAYNPPCIFTPYATCPLPPPQNKLSIAIEAGEKIWGGAEGH